MFLFIDIIINFRTAFIKDILIVDDWKLIAINYLKGHFLFDLIATPPFYLILPELMFLKLARIFRMNACFRINPTPTFSQFLEKINFRWNTQIYIVRILKFLCVLYIASHLIACLWHYLNRFDLGYYNANS